MLGLQQVQTLTARTDGLVRDVAKLVESTGGVLPSCQPLTSAATSIVTNPDSAIAGSVATQKCNPSLVPATRGGETDRVCLADGSWTGQPLVCTSALPGATEAAAVKGACAEVYAARTAGGGAAPPSGPYWVTLSPGSTMQVLCDMDHATKDGKRGWTLCGKYDRNSTAGPKYLAQGFARANVGAPGDMATVSQFGAAGRRWSSIDCRPIVDGSLAAGRSATSHLMHMGLDDEDVQNAPLVLFTTLAPKVQQDATNLFNVLVPTDDLVCPEPSATIFTFNAEWSKDIVQDLDDGATGGNCPDSPTGFCSIERIGRRFSNGGRSRNPANPRGCDGSGFDTIYWVRHPRSSPEAHLTLTAPHRPGTLMTMGATPVPAQPPVWAS